MKNLLTANRCLLCLLPFLAWSHVVLARDNLVIEIVKDIRPGVEGSSPEIHSVARHQLFFSAYEVGTGAELWKSDGTASGTMLVKDIRVGAQGSSITRMGAQGGTALFSADDGVHGHELWASDGTATGTYLVKDVYPGTASGAPVGGKAFLGKFFFPGQSPAHGIEPWMSDGTPTGTSMLKDIESQGDSIILFFEFDAVAVPELGVAFFQATSGKTRNALWASDGTTAGTREVVAFPSGPGHARPQNLTSCGGRLFFSIYFNASREDLYSTDGTQTQLVKSFVPRSAYHGPDDFVCCDDILYFNAHDGVHGQRLWRSDGTEAGTWMLDDIPLAEGPFYGTVLACLDEWVIALAYHQDTGYELWRYAKDGSETALIMDVYPGVASSLQPIELGSGSAAVLDGVLYVSLDDGIHGRELWRTDGTPAGTWMVHDLNFGFSGSNPRYLTVLGDRLYLTADDGVHGNELFMLREKTFSFVSQPRAMRLRAGSTLRLNAPTRDGEGVVVYRWFRDDLQISVAASPELLIHAVFQSDTGWYTCQATDENEVSIRTAPVYIHVVAEDALPLTSGLGLIFFVAILASACRSSRLFKRVKP